MVEWVSSIEFRLIAISTESSSPSRWPSFTGDANKGFVREVVQVLQEISGGERKHYLHHAFSLSIAHCIPSVHCSYIFCFFSITNECTFVYITCRRFQIVLLGIVWNAFCNAFSKGLGLDLTHAIALLILLPLLHLGALFAFFSIFRYSGGVNKTSTTTTTTMKAGRDAVAATFCASHKTLAFGLPLINTIFSGSSNLASYCAPIMLVHPIQLLIGSFVVPYFKQFTGVSEER